MMLLILTIDNKENNDFGKDQKDKDELVMAFQLTRHGARSTITHIDEPTINTQEWENGLGYLTPSGERQHFLLSRKHRQKLIDDLQLLSDKFDPREIFVISTDYNRTIMSAYSENLGWYPLGSVEKLESGQKDQAIPPFSIENLDDIISDLDNNPTRSGYQPIPIHVGQQAVNRIFRAYASEVCPVVKQFERKAREEATFAEVNERYKDNILKALKEDWEVGEHDFVSASKYTDNFYASYFDDRLIQDYKLDVDKVDGILADQFYFHTFYFDEMVRLSSTHFLNLVYSTFDAKIKTISTGEDDGSGMKHKKLIYISAHDTTLAAMLSGIEQKQELQPFYASHFLIELWKKEGTDGSSPEHYYAKWIYNDKNLNINNSCDDQGKCEYPKFKEFLQSREYQGDWEAACQNMGGQINFETWYIVGGSTAGAIILGVLGYLGIKKIFVTSKAY